MAARIRPSSVFVGSKKIATVSDGTYTTKSGDESQIADGGYIGHSDGAVTSTLQVNTIVPVTGETKTLRQAMLQKKYLRIKLSLIDGGIEDVEMRLIDNGYNWDHKSGVLKGSFSFEGGEPTLTG